MSLEISIQAEIKQITQTISNEMQSRGYRVSNELRNTALEVLRGQRSGRIYRVPHSKSYYQASAPGEPPAERTGTLRNSWAQQVSTEFGQDTITITSSIVSTVPYAGILQDGRGRIAPRPFREPILEQARPQITAIYSEPYFK